MVCCTSIFGTKFLFRGESPRDHVDLLLSITHQSTLTVCDIPGCVANHGNQHTRNKKVQNVKIRTKAELTGVTNPHIHIVNNNADDKQVIYCM